MLLIYSHLIVHFLVGHNVGVAVGSTYGVDTACMLLFNGLSSVSSYSGRRDSVSSLKGSVGSRGQFCKQVSVPTVAAKVSGALWGLQ